jgi:hypothetical protein
MLITGYRGLQPCQPCPLPHFVLQRQISKPIHGLNHLMLSTPINLINAKWEEMYDSAMFWFYTTIQAIVFDANNFCYRISQLTQLTSPERFKQTNYVGQQEESPQQIVLIPREEFLLQTVSGFYYHNVILQNLSNKIHASTVKI